MKNFKCFLFVSMFIFVGIHAYSTPNYTEKINVDREHIRKNMAHYIGLDVIPDPIERFQDKDIAYVDGLYRKARAREQHGVYNTAFTNYEEICRYSIDILKGEKVKENKIYSLLPYVIGSAYRLGIVSHKSIKGNMVKLQEQLETYKIANDTIDSVLALISDLKTDNRAKLNRTLYGIIYYSKGYNKMALAYTLLKGNMWKNYTIYMPADIVSIVRSAVKDFEKSLDFNNLSRPIILKINGYEDPYALLAKTDVKDYDWDLLIENYVDEYLFFIKTVSYEIRTIQLCYYTGDTDYIAGFIRKKVTNSLYPMLDLYNSDEHQDILERAVIIDKMQTDMSQAKELYQVTAKYFELLQY